MIQDLRRPNVYYHDKQWTSQQQAQYMNKTQWQRLQDSKGVVEKFGARTSRFKSSTGEQGALVVGTRTLGIIARVFPTPHTDDEIKWPIETQVAIMLCYRGEDAILGPITDFQNDARKVAGRKFMSYLRV